MALYSIASGRRTRVPPSSQSNMAVAIELRKAAFVKLLSCATQHQPPTDKLCILSSPDYSIMYSGLVLLLL